MELRACIEALKFIARPMVVVNGQIVIDGGEHTGAVLTQDRTSRLTRL